MERREQLAKVRWELRCRWPDARLTDARGTWHGLRDGLERILRGNTGGLIVLGWDKTVESMCTGGFVLDVDFTATRLRELCKLDGGIVVDKDITKILRAGVQLVPDPTIPTEETGTRHRTADRVSKQVGFPVVSVSQSMRLIALYVDGQRRVLEDSAAILSRANQALATLERYKLRLDEVAGTLSALEIEDLVTVRDVSVVAQRLEDGAAHRHGDRRVRGGVGHGRASARPPAGRVDRGRGARAGARGPGLRAGADREALPHGRRGPLRPERPGPLRAPRTAHGGESLWATPAPPRRSTRRSPRAASASLPRSRVCPARIWITASWSTSAVWAEAPRRERGRPSGGRRGGRGAGAQRP